MGSRLIKQYFIPKGLQGGNRNILRKACQPYYPIGRSEIQKKYRRDPDKSISSGDNVEHKIYPDPVMDTLETMKNIKAGTSLIVGDETFVIVSFGPKTGRGYGAKIKEIKKTGDGLIITAEPGEATDPTAEIMSYDYAVEVVPGKYENIEFKINEGYMPL